MVCPACGAQFDAVGSFCPRCGAQVAPVAGGPAAGYAYAPQPGYAYGGPAPVRVQRNLHLMTVLWGGFAAYRLASGLFGIFFFQKMAHGGMFGRHFAFHPQMMPFFSALLPFTVVTTLAIVGLTAMAAYGLLQRRPWGRTFAIVMSILSLLKFPLGTALGIYTLWVMAPAASAVEYETMADRSQPGF